MIASGAEGVWSGWETLSPVLRYANFYDAQPGGSFGPRYISDFQVLLVQSGAGFAIVDERRFELVTGDLVYYGPNVRHIVTSSTSSPLRLLGLHFVFRQQDAIGLNIDYAAHVQSTPFMFDQKEPVCPLAPALPAWTRPHDTSPLRSHIEALVLSAIASPAGRPIEKRGRLLLMLDAWRVAISAPCGSTLNRPEIAGAQTAISEEFANPPSLDRLAKAAGLSVDHFGRIFKQQTGWSVRQYVCRQRLIEARRLLVQGALNVSEVAQAVGFDDPFYFSRVFKRSFGVSPSHFRQQYPLT